MKRCLPLVLLLGLLLPVASSAAIFRAAEDDNELFSISIPVQDDLYVAGGLVHVKEQIQGDLVIAAGEVEITGDVTGDLIAAGGNVIVKSTIGDDLRVAGGNITIDGIVKDDLIITGGNVRIGSDAIIRGDTIIFGGLVIIDGTIEGNLNSNGGNVVFSGTVQGDATIRGEKVQLEGVVKGNSTIVAREVKVGETAALQGDLEYWTPEEENPFAAIVKGTATFNPELRIYNRDDVVGTTMFGAMKVAMLAFLGYSLLAASLFILLMVLLTKNYFTNTAKKVRKAPWMCMLYGLLYFVLLPVIAVLFLVSVIGAPIGLLLFVTYGFTIFFAKPLAAMVMAKWIEAKYKKNWGKVGFFFVSIAAYIVLKLLWFIPIVGWLLILAAVLIAFGALIQTKMEIWKKVA
ncbi:MAG: hypothetical protein WCX61_05665 [Candidatus Peribacteraceae bacterium]